VEQRCFFLTEFSISMILRIQLNSYSPKVKEKMVKFKNLNY
jgi:hypothetical protein